MIQRPDRRRPHAAGRPQGGQRQGDSMVRRRVATPAQRILPQHLATAATRLAADHHGIEYPLVEGGTQGL